MVNSNPDRKVDLDTLPPIVMGADGHLYFMDTTPGPWETFKTMLTASAIGCGILAAVLGLVAMVVCLAAELPLPVWVLKGSTGGTLAAALALSTYRGTDHEEKKNH